jgi:hypothetical protein
MTFRPITDTWILARPKFNPKVMAGYIGPDGKPLKSYYGGYVAGFLSRARHLLGVPIDQPLLHACGGCAKAYPFKGLGYFDKTLDLNPVVKPDFLQDARDPWPTCREEACGRCDYEYHNWPGILIDPPYSPADAQHYDVGADVLPTPAELQKRAWEVLAPGGKCGILHYLWCRPPAGAIPVALITIYVGYNNKARTLSVWEKPA